MSTPYTERGQTVRPTAGCRRRIALVAALLVGGCDLPGQPKPEDRPLPENKVESFDALFRQNCAGCHGADGRLGPAPPLNDPLFLAIVPDAVLLGTITEGRPGTPMPAFISDRAGPLTEAQVKVLAEGLKPHWGTTDRPAEQPPPYSASGGKPGDAGRGAGVFARACASCHGSEGRGGSVGAINDANFLALISNQALRRIVITGRPDLGMPNFAETLGRPPDFKPLTSAEVSDVVALLASWRRGSSASGK